MLQLWWLPVSIYVVLAFGFVRWMGKKYIVGDKRTRRLLVQYLTCLAGATLLAVLTGSVGIAFTSVIVIWPIGFINGIACFYHWKAQDLSLGKTSVFTIWDDVIAMSLSFAFLDEGRFLNIWSSSGIVLSVVALGLFAYHAYRHDNKGLSWRCLYYIGIYSLMWGVAMFYERKFSADHMPVSAFLLAWYGGSTLSALALRIFMHEDDPKQRESLTGWDVRITILYALSVLACLAVAYWAYRSPQTVVQPIFFVSEAIVPVVVARIFFNTQKGEQYDSSEKLYLGLAITAVVLICVGFS